MASGCGLVLGLERCVNLKQRRALALGDRAISGYRCRDGVISSALREDAGLHIQGLGGDTQALGDTAEDLGTGLAQATLDLTEVRVGDVGGLRELAQ